MDVLKAVEGVGGGAEALEVDVERLGGDEVGAAGAGEAEAGLDGAVADGSLRVGGEDHVAAEAGVATEKDEAGLAERDIAPFAVKVDGNLAEGGGAAEGAFELNGAGVGDVGVGAGGVGLNAEMPLLGVGEPEGEVGVSEGEGGFFLVELEVEAGAGGFDVGEAGGGAGVFLGGGGGLDVGGLEEDALEVPLAVGEVDEVDAGVGEADGGELDRRRQRELMRRVARTELARMMGSEPKAGSSPTTRFSMVKPGSGRRLRVTLSRWTGRPRLWLMLVAMRRWIAVDADQRREKNEEKDHQGRNERGREGGGGCGCLETAGRLRRRLRRTRRLDPFAAWTGSQLQFSVVSIGRESFGFEGLTEN